MDSMNNITVVVKESIDDHLDNVSTKIVSVTSSLDEVRTWILEERDRK